VKPQRATDTEAAAEAGTRAAPPRAADTGADRTKKFSAIAINPLVNELIRRLDANKDPNRSQKEIANELVENDERKRESILRQARRIRSKRK
jgi:hypothetical protein